MVDIMGKAREIGRERNKMRSTVFKLEEYQIEQDPRKSKMIGYDMFNMDENGVPKKVEVYHYHKDNKTQDINNFATRSAMMHTRPGGLIRLSQFKVNGDGSYTTSHMQRIAEDDGPKVSSNQTKFDISFMKGWTKIYPKKDAERNLEIFKRGGRLFHKADVMVIPEDSKPATMNFGTPEFDAELQAILEQAINDAPRGTQPMIMVRQAGKLTAEEIRFPNFKMDAENKAVPLTKEEIIQRVMTSGKLADKYLPAHQACLAENEPGQVEFVPGFAIQAIGLKWDGKSMQKNPQTGEDEPKYNDRSTIEQFILETAQRHRLPKEEGDTKTRYALDQGGPQYTFGILSYRTKQVPEGTHVQADLDTLGRDHGAKMWTSPNAGLDVKPNPYKPATQTPNQGTSETAPAAQNEAPANQAQGAAPAAAASQASQPAPQNSQPASQPTQAAGQPETVEEEPDMGDEVPDFGLDDFADDFEDSLDELESEMAAQKL